MDKNFKKFYSLMLMNNSQCKININKNNKSQKLLSKQMMKICWKNNKQKNNNFHIFRHSVIIKYTLSLIKNKLKIQEIIEAKQEEEAQEFLLSVKKVKKAHFSITNKIVKVIYKNKQIINHNFHNNIKKNLKNH